MQLSELSRQSRVPVPSIKFYLREGLLHRGQPLSPRTSAYDASHLRRLELVKILIDVQGLSVAGTRKVLEAVNTAAIDEAASIRRGVAALSADRVGPQNPQESAPPELVSELGNRHGMDDPNICALTQALDTAVKAGTPVDPATLTLAWELLVKLAAATLTDLPADPTDAAEHVVIGTAIHDRLISALWFLSRREAAERLVANRAGSICQGR